MGKLTKTQLLREKTDAAVKQSKQSTLDNLPTVPDSPVEADPRKQILITDIKPSIKVEEVSLQINFRLAPSKVAFSKVNADLYFSKTKIHTLCLNILPSKLSGDTFEFTVTLFMKGICAGAYPIKLEMYDLWAPGEKLTSTSKEINLDYIPQTRESKWVKIPTVKCMGGNDLAIIANTEKEIYRDIEKTQKRERTSKRDSW